MGRYGSDRRHISLLHESSSYCHLSKMLQQTFKRDRHTLKILWHHRRVGGSGRLIPADVALCILFRIGSTDTCLLIQETCIILELQIMFRNINLRLRYNLNCFYCQFVTSNELNVIKFKTNRKNISYWIFLDCLIHKLTFYKIRKKCSVNQLLSNVKSIR